MACFASSRLWAGLLDRYRGGQPLALLNGLLGLATLLPAVTSAWPLMMVSGLLFGAVFLSVVASTTALVRHNLPPGRGPARNIRGVRKHAPPPEREEPTDRKKKKR